MKGSPVLRPIAQTIAATAGLVTVLAFQGTAWGDEVNSSQTDNSWVRVEDLEPVERQPSDLAAPPSQQGWGTTTEEGALRGRDGGPGRAPSTGARGQVPSNWQFKSKSLEENASPLPVELEETFTF